MGGRLAVMIDGRLVSDGPLAQMLVSRTVRLSVAGATEVPRALGRLEGVTGVREAGADAENEGFAVYLVDTAEGAQVIPAIVAAAVTAGWTIGAVAPERYSLQAVFQRLQDEAAAAMEVRA